jgi:hypothetical protein
VAVAVDTEEAVVIEEGGGGRWEPPGGAQDRGPPPPPSRRVKIVWQTLFGIAGLISSQLETKY